MRGETQPLIPWAEAKYPEWSLWTSARHFHDRKCHRPNCYTNVRQYFSNTFKHLKNVQYQDMHSYGLEYSRGLDGHNVITVIMHEYHLNLQEALYWLSGYASKTISKLFSGQNNLPTWVPTMMLSTRPSRSPLWSHRSVCSRVRHLQLRNIERLWRKRSESEEESENHLEAPWWGVYYEGSAPSQHGINKEEYY